MQVYYDKQDNRKCEIIFLEGGNATVRLSASEVRYHIPRTRLRTAEEHAEWLLLHPKNKLYLHEVLEVVAAAKRNPRKAEEGDSEWMAFLRTRAAFHVDLVDRWDYAGVEKFKEQYQAATGEDVTTIRNRPGVHVRHEKSKTWCNSLSFRFVGTIPDGCPVEVHTCSDGTFSITNTRFVWEMIAREGFRLDP